MTIVTNQQLADMRSRAVWDAIVAYDDALQAAPRSVALSPIADAASDLRDAILALQKIVKDSGTLPRTWRPTP